mgnify:CR=1 FL=1
MNIYRFNDLGSKKNISNIEIKGSDEQVRQISGKKYYADKSKAYKVIFGIESINKGNTEYNELEFFLASENISEVHSADFTNVFSSASDETGFINNMLKFFGINIRPRDVYKKVWNSSNPINLGLNLKIFAENNSITEVINPVRDLLKLVLVNYINKGATNNEVINKLLEHNVFFPPGAELVKSSFMNKVFSNYFKVDKYSLLYIRIGNFMILRNILIRSINVTWDFRNLDVNGLPMSADISVDIEGVFLWDRNKMDTLKPKVEKDEKNEDRIVVGNDGDDERTIDIDKILKDIVDALKNATNQFKEKK